MERSREIYSVSKLNGEIKYLLEDTFPFIWITGEISNFTPHVSGHHYFTLKDKTSAISSVMFRGQNRNLKFLPENGMSVTGFGRVSLYEPRGTYQIIFEYMEPKGVGSLQIAFEQLKKKLEKEGLFNKSFKKELVYLPKRIVIITSIDGAVIHDLINIMSRRFHNIFVDIVKVKVQGESAADEIEEALSFADSTSPDVIVLARGGGSLEDLAPFNSEKVARAVFETKTPVVSAIGHETDVTITDFVADLRAETPSAAAELILPEKRALKRNLNFLSEKLVSAFERVIKGKNEQFNSIFRRLKSPEKKVIDKRLRLDDLSIRVVRVCNKNIISKKDKLENLSRALYLNNPVNRLKKLDDNIQISGKRLKNGIRALLNNKKAKLNELNGKLESLNPLSVLERGYSITRTVPQKKVVSSVDGVETGKRVEIIVNDGTINCLVEEKNNG